MPNERNAFIKCKQQTMERLNKTKKISKCKPLVIVNACCECAKSKMTYNVFNDTRDGMKKTKTKTTTIRSTNARLPIVDGVMEWNRHDNEKTENEK